MQPSPGYVCNLNTRYGHDYNLDCSLSEERLDNLYAVTLIVVLFEVAV